MGWVDRDAESPTADGKSACRFAARIASMGPLAMTPLRARRRFSVSMSLFFLLVLLAEPALSQPGPAFELPGGVVLFDETIRIGVSGLPAGRFVTVRLEQHDTAGLWRSHAIFVADNSGGIDLSRMAPLSGTYSGIAPMGLVWSVQRDGAVEPREAFPAPDLSPVTAQLMAEIDGVVVATATRARHPVAPDVEVTPVRENGLVGMFYRPAGDQPLPAMLVLGGSGGGMLGPESYPGGLASQGYAVLALAYFGIEGRPSQLHLQPLEYFRSALDWLGAHPAVDETRIGVFGSSRGGELGLLLGATYPQIAAVVAHVPSHVLWEGCCDPVALAAPAWTHEGNVLPHIQVDAQSADDLVFALDDAWAVERAAIPVENINGPVLLISGQDDDVWPSTYMAEQVVQRLRRHDFPHPVTHLANDDAGHAIGRPHYRMFPATGGTPSGNARARTEHWESMLRFLDDNLRRPPTRP